MKHRNEIIIALIGLSGVIFTAVVSNYDKLFQSDSEKAASFPYESVEDIDMQIRYFVEVSGFRAALDEMQKVAAEKYKLKYGATEAEVNCVLDNQIQNEQLIELFVETMRNHISLEQIKDLNRIYSSESMKSYNKASPLIVRDLINGIDKLYERMHIRNQAVIRSMKDTNEASCPAT